MRYDVVQFNPTSKRLIFYKESININLIPVLYEDAPKLSQTDRWVYFVIL